MKMRWTLAPGAAMYLWAGPLLGQSEQFRGDAPHTGVVETTGVERFGGVAWRFETLGAVRSSAALSEGTLYVGSSDGFLYALHVDDGSLRWKFDAGAPISSSPAVTQGVAIFASRDGVLHGASATDGRSLWRLEAGLDLELPWGHEGWDYIHGSAAVSGDLAYWGSGDGSVKALEPPTGALRWTFQTGGRVRGTPAIADGVLVVGSGDGVVYALGAESGEELWRFETAGVDLDAADYGFDRRQISASASIAGGVVYIGSRDATLYALNAADGSRIWGFNEGTAWVIGTAAVSSDRVFSTRSSSGSIRAIDRVSGVEAWRVQGGGTVFSSPVLVDETLYVGDGGGVFRALDASTGATRWEYRTGGGIWASPVVHDGRVYVGSDDGFVYAFARADGPELKRAVFFDPDLAGRATFGGAEQHRVVHEFFEGRGYAAIDAEGLEAFLSERIGDRAPSVVVFGMDVFPDGIGGGPGSLARRYLDAGGKIVWMGFPPGYIVRDPDSGAIIDTDKDAPAALLDVDFDAYDGDQYGVSPTESGLRWGLEGHWVGQGTTLPESVTTVLAADERSRATAWVKNYGGPVGTGFVFLRATVSTTVLADFLEVAEYGFGGMGSAR